MVGGAVYIASDHRGFEKKSEILMSHPDFIDLGPETYDPEDDYNDYAVKVARKVAAEPGARGVLLCGSAHGICIQANRFKGIRAIEGFSEDLVKLGREHNDANILCISADFTADPEPLIQIFLNTPAFTDEKYVRRNRKLDEEMT